MPAEHEPTDAQRSLVENAEVDMARRPVTLPGMQRVVVAVDPSGARGMDDEAADSIGIVVAALGVEALPAPIRADTPAIRARITSTSLTSLVSIAAGGLPPNFGELFRYSCHHPIYRSDSLKQGTRARNTVSRAAARWGSSKMLGLIPSCRAAETSISRSYIASGPPTLNVRCARQIPA
jgi:hypothetical protein